MNKRWHITIWYGENTQPDHYPSATMLPRDEGFFGVLRFQDANGLEHLVSVAQAFTADEEHP